MDSAMSWLIIYSYIDIFGCMNVSKNIDEYKYISWRFTFNKTKYCVAITGQSQLNWDTNRRIETIWEGRSESGRSDMHAHIQKKKQRERRRKKKERRGTVGCFIFFGNSAEPATRRTRSNNIQKLPSSFFPILYPSFFFSSSLSLSLSPSFSSFLRVVSIIS